jgi:hypothetical protein
MEKYDKFRQVHMTVNVRFACSVAKAEIQTHTQNKQYLLLFEGKSNCTEVPQCSFTRPLPDVFRIDKGSPLLVCPLNLHCNEQISITLFLLLKSNKCTLLVTSTLNKIKVTIKSYNINSNMFRFTQEPSSGSPPVLG